MAASWLAENPGNVKLTWFNYEITTSVAFLLAILAIFIMLIWLALKLLFAIINMPKELRKSREISKQKLGIDALTEAFIALGEKDNQRAKQAIAKAEKYLNNPTLPRLMHLQLIKQSGQTEKLATQFKLLAENKQTKAIALKGLIEEARRHGNMNDAMRYADDLIKLHPRDAAAIKNIIGIYSYHQRWQEALQLTSKAQAKHIISRAEAVEIRATIYLEKAQHALDERNRNSAIALLKSALKNSPGLTAAAVNLANIYLQIGKKSSAIKILRKAWKYTPHPELENIYNGIFAELPSNKRLAKIKELTKQNPDALESQLAMARAAINAEQWEMARNHLKIALAKQETVTACKLMAELEEAEHHAETEAKQWLERAATAASDPLWQCTSCGNKPENWIAYCNKCYQFNSIKWLPAHPMKLATA